MATPAEKHGTWQKPGKDRKQPKIFSKDLFYPIVQENDLVEKITFRMNAKLTSRISIPVHEAVKRRILSIQPKGKGTTAPGVRRAGVPENHWR